MDVVICSDWEPNEEIAEIVQILVDGGYSVYYDIDHIRVGMDLTQELYNVVFAAPVCIFFYPTSKKRYKHFFDESITLLESYKDKRMLLVVLSETDCIPPDIEAYFSKADVLYIKGNSQESLNQVAFKIAMKLTQIIGRPKRPRIFLCHAHEDYEQVQELYKKLQSAGFEPWYDKESLNAGDLWDNEIAQSIENTDFFVLCLSSTSVKKRGYIDKEIELAGEEYAKRGFRESIILPVRLDKCEIPNIKMGSYRNLSDFQWIDLWEKDSYDKLINGLWKQWKHLGRRSRY
ncbi:toll/interleukin-1 receptor domain-containing protein [Spirosoma validum]|uniref:Toll/interleukin-1 receptor domain-containing protein n=1 Tax=Spirosoma validum TaxID=2771355 RepID=A0A927GDK6_9BACT|nr:toll/interleukin-1 receptor domain-containing protein [Spirosoma validum]MBD2753773.1 toll/interleukin-1 receptor domain-containing protein [Spirosoma validum]